MKKTAILLAFCGLPLAVLQAQTVPLLINYQGKVTGGNGVPLGATGTAPNFTPAPENRKIIFRIFDAAAAGTGTRLYSEEQNVTLSLGEFSVLLGQGTAAVYNAVQESKPALDSIFTSAPTLPLPPTGPGRYLEIVVDNGDGVFTTADTPISPRQRLTTTAYSFRAAVADTVSASAITPAALSAGAVTAAKIADGAISAIKISDGSISTVDLADNLITSSKIADGSVVTADLANASVTAAKLDAGIGVWAVSGANVYRPAGSVGVGKVPGANIELDVNGDIAASGNIAATGAVTASSLTTTGPFAATAITSSAGVNITGSNVLHLGSGVAGKDISAGRIGYQTYSTALDIVGAGTTGTNRKVKIWGEGGTEITGRVGIGNANPAVPLDVTLYNDLQMTDNGYQSDQGTEAGSGSLQTWTARGTFNSNNPASIEIYGMSGPDELYGNRRAVAPVGIRSEGWIASARGLMIYSDRRIKRDLHASGTDQDLEAIGKLKVTDYRMVDHTEGDMVWKKGFIAQEVEKVIPNAVTRSREFVPDIFSVATTTQWHAGVNTLSLTLAKDHGLKAGDRVRLHVDGSRMDLDVREVPSGREFVVGNCDRSPGKVLVYGKQVDDFRTVDYDRIFTTAVGALQELKEEKDKEVAALQEENAGLRTRLAALEANDKVRDAKLAVIESLLISAGKSKARTVSLNAGE